MDAIGAHQRKPLLYDFGGAPMVYSESAQCNTYLNADDAGASGRRTLKPGSKVYVWRYEDGTYGWSAILDCKTPGHPGAVLVETLVARR